MNSKIQHFNHVAIILASLLCQAAQPKTWDTEFATIASLCVLKLPEVFQFDPSLKLSSSINQIPGANRIVASKLTKQLKIYAETRDCARFRKTASLLASYFPTKFRRIRESAIVRYGPQTH